MFLFQQGRCLLPASQFCKREGDQEPKSESLPSSPLDEIHTCLPALQPQLKAHLPSGRPALGSAAPPGRRAGRVYFAGNLHRARRRCPAPEPLRNRLTQELSSFLHPLKHFLLYHEVCCKLKRNENHVTISPNGGSGEGERPTALLSIQTERERKHPGWGVGGAPALWDPSPDQATRPLTAHLSPAGLGYGIPRSLPYIHIL